MDILLQVELDKLRHIDWDDMNSEQRRRYVYLCEMDDQEPAYEYCPRSTWSNLSGGAE